MASYAKSIYRPSSAVNLSGALRGKPVVQADECLRGYCGDALKTIPSFGLLCNN